jgi:hypothetical protein
MDVIKLYACAFKSDVTLAEARAKFAELSTWEWLERDNDRWGEYISARAMGDPHRGMIKLFVEADHYVINILLKSDEPEDQVLPLCDAVEKTIFDKLLPAIGAHDLTRVDDYE